MRVFESRSERRKVLGHVFEVRWRDRMNNYDKALERVGLKIGNICSNVFCNYFRVWVPLQTRPDPSCLLKGLRDQEY